MEYLFSLSLSKMVEYDTYKGGVQVNHLKG